MLILVSINLSAELVSEIPNKQSQPVSLNSPLDDLQGKSPILTDDGNLKVGSERRLDDLSDGYMNMMETGRKPEPNRSQSIYRPGDECILYAEIFPFYYELISRSSYFTISFSSNCLQKVEVVFEVQFKNSKNVNWFLHPENLTLNLWGNLYKIKFGQPRIIDKFDIMRSFEYRQGVIRNLHKGRVSLNLKNTNSVNLDPQFRNTFNKFNIKKLTEVKGLVSCRQVLKRMKGWRVMLKKKKKFIETMKKNNTDDDEIKLMLKTKKFSPVPEESNAKSERSLTENSTKENGMNDRQTKQSVLKMSNKDMTEEEKAIFEKNKKKMVRRLKSNFIKRIEIRCDVK
jgi:hypothetical protein